MTFNKNKAITIIITLVGVLFLVIPMICDSYSHHIQDYSYKASHEQIIACRSNLALQVIGNPHTLWEEQRLLKNLDNSCGQLPQYDDFSYQSPSGIVSIYNWLAQKVKFIPL